MKVIYDGATSALCVKSFFDMHIKESSIDVLDLTYGNGTFWNWNYDGEWQIDLTANDLNGYTYTGPEHQRPVDYTHDFRNSGWKSRSYDVVVFDPPFTANGPSKDGHQKRYGADRSQAWAPQNIHEVRSLLASGLIEAMRLSKKWVLLKTQDVIESGKLHDSEGLARMLFQQFGFRIVDYRLYDSTRRPQPNEARGATQKHFYGRPSVFYLAKRGAQ